MPKRNLLSSDEVVQIFMNMPDDGNVSDDPNFSGSAGGLDGCDSDKSDADVYDAVRPVSPLTRTWTPHLGKVVTPEIQMMIVMPLMFLLSLHPVHVICFQEMYTFHTFT
jgi:hypothetical protein